MRINCPTCELAFEVSDNQTGQKALCPECETRFIIPSDGEGKGEILSVGKDGKDERSGKETVNQGAGDEAGEKETGEKDAGEKDVGEKEVGEKEGGEKEAGEKEAGEKDAGEKDAGNDNVGEGNLAGDPAEEIVEERGAWGYLAVGVAIGLLFGFLIGWLVWGSPDTDGRFPAGNPGEGNNNPFLLDDTN